MPRRASSTAAWTSPCPSAWYNSTRSCEHVSSASDISKRSSFAPADRQSIAVPLSAAAQAASAVLLLSAAATAATKSAIVVSDGGSWALFPLAAARAAVAADAIARSGLRFDKAGTAKGTMFGPGIYLAENATRDESQELDAGEDISVSTLSTAAVAAAIRSGEISHALVITAMSRALDLRLPHIDIDGRP